MSRLPSRFPLIGLGLVLALIVAFNISRPCRPGMLRLPHCSATCDPILMPKACISRSIHCLTGTSTTRVRKPTKKLPTCRRRISCRPKLEVSVQYRIRGSEAPRILQGTGKAAQVVEVHLVPKLRSLLARTG